MPLAVLALLAVMPAPAAADDARAAQQAAMRELVERTLEVSGIPGAAVAVVSRDAVLYEAGFGFADVAAGRRVDAETLFEIGSNSKAFTGLLAHRLAEQGRLDLDKDVRDYLPWLALGRKGRVQRVTLRQLLHHTSGLPGTTIAAIPELEGEHALEATVRATTTVDLAAAPGERFEYATVNYDVLGLAMEVATGRRFADLLAAEVFAPLGLTSTYAGRYRDGAARLATGYKLGFFGSRPYEAPRYDGNTPAGYIVSNARDMAAWLQIQLGGARGARFAAALAAARAPDRTVPPSGDGASYASGWEVYQEGGGLFAHSGANPAYSSFAAFRPDLDLGVVVLANRNDANTAQLGHNLLRLLQGRPRLPLQQDTAARLSAVMNVVFLVALATIGVFGFLLARGLVAWRRNTPGPAAPVRRKIAGVARLAIVAAVLALAIYYLPILLFYGFSWDFILIWGPSNVGYCLGALVAALACFTLYRLLHVLGYGDRAEHPVFVVMVSILSGFCNVLLVFVINEGISRATGGVAPANLAAYFGIVLFAFVASQAFLRATLVHLGNEIVYGKRMLLADAFLRIRYQEFEQLEAGTVAATLNNDTEAVSDTMNVLVSFASSTATVLWALVYLWFINSTALVFFVVFVAVMVTFYILVGRRAEALWERTRDTQNTFFKLIDDLVQGFKELSLSRDRRAGYRRHLTEISTSYRDQRTQADFAYSKLNVLGELLFLATVALIVFAFPRLIADFDHSTIQSYAVVFIFLMGPVNDLLNSLKYVARLRVSWRRINAVVDRFAGRPTPPPAVVPDGRRLALRGVTFKYGGQRGDEFQLGPIDYAFHRGEVAYIVGGNGSGKSTLAKLITGLYEPNAGGLWLDDRPVEPEQLRAMFAAVFSDHHLFDRLYGVDLAAKRDQAASYLAQLGLDHKAQIEGDTFSTIQLSQGQRRRLALVTCLLEDREFLFFDEITADQDPEFRRYFYETFCPELKRQGKCVIVITHDDRYFHLADRLLTLECGLERRTEPPQ